MLIFNQLRFPFSSLHLLASCILFHISRHSFAKVAKQRGTDNAKLKDLLAHSSVKITEGYMGGFDTAENDRALQHIFQKEEYSSKDELIKLLNNMSSEEINSLIKQIKR